MAAGARPAAPSAVAMNTNDFMSRFVGCLLETCVREVGVDVVESEEARKGINEASS